MTKREYTEIRIVRYASPAGLMVLGAHEGRLCLCDWAESTRYAMTANRLRRLMNAQYVEAPTDATERAMRELGEYFAGERRGFTVEVQCVGTPFQQRVWKELMRIPYGCTISYAEQASRLGIPKGVRAVASANAANALAVFVPCHRVMGANGSLTGYAGGLPAKRLLLELEKGVQL